MKNKIAVVSGGDTLEREVSIVSGQLVASEINSLGFEVQQIILEKDAVKPMLGLDVDSVVIMLHGGWGEDGRFQSFLELLNLPYSGSRPLPSAMAMNKVWAKTIFDKFKVATPLWKTIKSNADLEEIHNLIPLPWIIKPVAEGSSVGIELIEHIDEKKILLLIKNYGELLIEEFIQGKILTVPIIDVDQYSYHLSPIEIVPTQTLIYDSQAKYFGWKKYNYKPDLSKSLLLEATDIAFQAHRALGCSGVTRVDMMCSNDGELSVLEVNTIPGMGATGNIISACKNQGLSQRELVKCILASIK